MFGVDDLPAKIATLLTPEPNTGCWLFIGKRESRNGYGRVWWEGAERQIHIVTYTLLIGPYPDGHVLDHRVCQTKPCANPYHLEPVTMRTNTLRGPGALYWYKPWS